MSGDSQVSVDLRALKALRVESSDLRHEVSTAHGETAELAQRLEQVEQELETLALANERLDQTRMRLEEAARGAREREAELTEVLRQAQVGYWETAEMLADARSDLEKKGLELDMQLERNSELHNQIDRIKSSKAWRAISAYRRFVNRFNSQ